MSDVVSDLMNTIDELNIKNNDLEKENAELREFKKEAMPILDNLKYWDTCPDHYKETLRRITTEDQGNE